MNKLKVGLVIAAILTVGLILLVLWYTSSKFRNWVLYVGHTGANKVIGTMPNYPNMTELGLDNGVTNKLGLFNYQPTGMLLSKQAWDNLNNGSVNDIATQITGSVEYMNVSWNKTAIGEIRDLRVVAVIEVPSGTTPRAVSDIINQSFVSAAFKELGMSANWKAYNLS